MKDEEKILSILLDPEIYDRIADDGCPTREQYVFNADGSTFYGGFIGEKLIGLIIHHGKLIHVNILREFRKHKRDFLRGVLRLLPRPLFAEIPSLFPSIIEFAKSEGFEEEEVRKGGYIKNGQQHDTHVMVLR